MISDNTDAVAAPISFHILINMQFAAILTTAPIPTAIGIYFSLSVTKHILEPNKYPIGEINNNIFTPGASAKPSFRSTIRLVNEQELGLLYGKQELEFGYTNFGVSNVYRGYRINVGINDFFNTHFSILGNSGSGKSELILEELHDKMEKILDNQKKIMEHMEDKNEKK